MNFRERIAYLLSKLFNRNNEFNQGYTFALGYIQASKVQGNQREVVIALQQIIRYSSAYSSDFKIGMTEAINDYKTTPKGNPS